MTTHPCGHASMELGADRARRCPACQKNPPTVTAPVEEVVDALLIFGRHLADCPAKPDVWHPKSGGTRRVSKPGHLCTCGLNAMLVRCGFGDGNPAPVFAHLRARSEEENRRKKVEACVAWLDAALEALGVSPSSDAAGEIVARLTEAEWEQLRVEAKVNKPSPVSREAIRNVYRERAAAAEKMKAVARHG